MFTFFENVHYSNDTMIIPFDSIMEFFFQRYNVICNLQIKTFSPVITLGKDKNIGIFFYIFHSFFPVFEIIKEVLF